VRIIDIAPTITDVLSIPRPPSFEGISLVDLASGTTREAVLALSEGEGGKSGPSVAIRTDRWKFYNGALYDLVGDPMERKNVSRRSRGLRRAMEVSLGKLLARPMLGAAGEIVPSEEVLEQLRALGYVQ
jgi:arylsulfatase A-like enzyme